MKTFTTCHMAWDNELTYLSSKLSGLYNDFVLWIGIATYEN
jgi:hypothetical protein